MSGSRHNGGGAGKIVGVSQSSVLAANSLVNSVIVGPTARNIPA